MLRLGTVLTAALLPIGLLAGGASAGTDPDQQCRQKWSDLVQIHGENGNPRGPVQDLDHRWTVTDRQAGRYAESATAADCGATYRDFRTAWGELQGFQYKLYPFDPAKDLRYAEYDRKHYLGLGNKLTPRLKHAFRVVRAQTPGAIHDLEPTLAGAADLDLADKAARQAFLQHARDVKGDSEHIQRMRHPYRVINDAELDEE